MSPAMIVFAGSRVVGAMLRANVRVPPAVTRWVRAAFRTAPATPGTEPAATAAAPRAPYRSTSRRETMRSGKLVMLDSSLVDAPGRVDTTSALTQRARIG